MWQRTLTAWLPQRWKHIWMRWKSSLLLRILKHSVPPFVPEKSVALLILLSRWQRWDWHRTIWKPTWKLSDSCLSVSVFVTWKFILRPLEEGTKHLKQIAALIWKYNEKETQVPLREPDLLMVITGGEMAYTREDGVKIIPIGTLRGWGEY